MTVEEALQFLTSILKPTRLNSIQELVFRGTWEGKTYKEIASGCDYDSVYIREVGSNLWKLISEVMGERVTKNNLQVVLRQRCLEASSPINTQCRSQDTTSIEQRSNWNETFHDSTFFGRTEELTTLRKWSIGDLSSNNLFISRTRIVAIIGMGGTGKTALVAKLTEQIQDEFEYLIWRSLHSAPPIAELLGDLIQSSYNRDKSSNELEVIPPLSTTLSGRIGQFIDLLRAYRYLIILDDWEAVLQSSQLAGYHRSGYEGYGHFIKQIAQENHQSCLLLVSREKPVEIALLTGEIVPVRVLKIKGLRLEEARQLLESKGYSKSEPGLDELIQRYRGNPLALEIISTTIQELFNGSISQFLTQTSLVIGDILGELLSQQIERVSELEKNILYWLAIERYPVSLLNLQANIWNSVSSSVLIAALESLERRCLIEKHHNQLNGLTLFTLSPVVMKYITTEFIEKVKTEINEVLKDLVLDQIDFLKKYSLVEKQENKGVEQIQTNLILTPVLDQLLLTVNTSQNLIDRLQQLLGILQNQPPQMKGYAESNILKLIEEIS